MAPRSCSLQQWQSRRTAPAPLYELEGLQLPRALAANGAIADHAPVAGLLQHLVRLCAHSGVKLDTTQIAHLTEISLYDTPRLMGLPHHKLHCNNYICLGHGRSYVSDVGHSDWGSMWLLYIHWSVMFCYVLPLSNLKSEQPGPLPPICGASYVCVPPPTAAVVLEAGEEDRGGGSAPESTNSRVSSMRAVMMAPSERPPSSSDWISKWLRWNTQ